MLKTLKDMVQIWLFDFVKSKSFGVHISKIAVGVFYLHSMIYV